MGHALPFSDRMQGTPSSSIDSQPWVTPITEEMSVRPHTLPCLIVAAGAGTRLRAASRIKPLHPILGVPLIERTVRTAMAAGVTTFYVVVGHEAEEVEAFLEDLSVRLQVPIVPIHNPMWHAYENGYSVLMARDLLTEPFLLVMSDHLFEPELLRRLVATPMVDDAAVLAVDHNLNNPLVDLDDVSRVWVEEGYIRAIGKGLSSYNGYDTGAFLCTPAVFDALETALATGRSGLGDAMQLLAQEGRLLAADVTGCFWVDVDTPEMARRAEEALLFHQGAKVTDGPVARYVNRPLSLRLTRWLARYPVTPNQITLAAFGLSLLAAFLFGLRSYPALLLGGVLAQLASVIDGCDGEIARLKYLSSAFGGWLDAVLDRYADALLLLGLTWYAVGQVGDVAWWVGVAAIVGSFMVGYTAVKYDQLIKERVAAGFRAGVRVGRDIRLALIFVAALFNLPVVALVTLALLMNGEAVRRIIALRRVVEP